MHGIDFKRLGVLLYAVVFLSYIAYLGGQHPMSIVERPKFPMPADVGDGLSRANYELDRMLSQAIAVRLADEKRRWVLDQRADQIREQDALLLSIEEEPTSPEIVPVQAEEVWITAAQFSEYLEQSNWPAELYRGITNVASCESGRLNPVTQSYEYRVNAIGDHGLAFGLGQVRIDYHPDKAQRYNLHDALQNLNASYEIYIEAGNSFLPWSCSSEYIGRRK